MKMLRVELMFSTKKLSLFTPLFAAALLLLWIDPASAETSTAIPSAPPAPVLVAPVNGASLVQPIGLDWDPVSAPGGPIGSYTWQVGTTNTFSIVIASGFTNMESDPSIPTRTNDKVSGLPNGTYFWRVKCTQLGPNGGVDSPWSTVRSFTVTGLGPAPARPSFITPTNNAQFHLVESFNIQWSSVVNAQYYILEADDEPTFSYPLTLTLSPINFGTQSGALWGNPLTIYYRYAPFPRTACAVFLRRRAECESPTPPRFQRACRRSRRLTEQVCSFHSLWIGQILQTHRCRATTSSSTQVPISRLLQWSCC